MAVLWLPGRSRKRLQKRREDQMKKLEMPWRKVRFTFDIWVWNTLKVQKLCTWIWKILDIKKWVILSGLGNPKARLSDVGNRDNTCMSCRLRIYKFRSSENSNGRSANCALWCRQPPLFDHCETLINFSCKVCIPAVPIWTARGPNMWSSQSNKFRIFIPGEMMWVTLLTIWAQY